MVARGALGGHLALHLGVELLQDVALLLLERRRRRVVLALCVGLVVKGGKGKEEDGVW